MKNPFPGMNPWLEEYWNDVHASLVVYASNQLNSKLPSDLVASVDERLFVNAGDAYLPRVNAGVGSTVAAAKPIVVDVSEMKVRRLEIADSKGHLVTVIEVLSPTNKCDAEHIYDWRRKRFENLSAGLSFVEIDLIREGGWTLPNHNKTLIFPKDRVCYAVCATRPWRTSKLEFYLCKLRERLPVISIPLRRDEQDATLDLQSLVDQSYEHGRYDRKIDYSKPPEPALPPEEMEWARKILESAANSSITS